MATSKRALLKWLAAFDLCWSVAALLYDLPAIARVPVWAWPFIIICPIYPALLSAVWWQGARDRRPNDWLFSFAVLPSAVYGVLALAFYPLVIHYYRFDWQALLEIPWVLAYAGQAWWLLWRRSERTAATWWAAAFLLASLCVQYASLSFGYLGLDLLPMSARSGLLLLGACLTAGLVARLTKRAD